MPPNDSVLKNFAQRLRRDSLIATSEAGTGHPTSCMSAADVVAVLFGREMTFDPKDPNRLGTDHFVLSKGHAAPVLWSALKEVGAIDDDLKTLRRFDSRLEGHPTPRVPGWVRVATGSLGQGLAASVGMSLARRLAKDPGRVYCLMGDGEIAEGSVWEAAQTASYQKLSNLCAIVDVNGLGQSGRTMHGHDIDAIAAVWRAFGWNALGIDGHDINAIVGAFETARKTADRPTVLLARTLKGKGVSFIEDHEGWHGKAVKKGAELDKALAEVGDPPMDLRIEARTRGDAPARPQGSGQKPEAPPYKLGEEIATREVIGDTLVRMGKVDPRIVALDAEVKNSTFSEKFKDAYPDRFVECFIAEQVMVGAALGFATEGYIPFASTFAAFLSRAYDFMRMAVYSEPKSLVLVGSHVGVSIGEDGASQMALEDMAMTRGLVRSTVLYPSDAMSAARLLEGAAQAEGVVYVRTSRPKTKVLYGVDETFPVGGSKVLRTSDKDVATVVGAGVTLHEALAAHEQLAQEGIAIRVVDAYSVKPIDAATLQKCADETQAIVTVEDHSPWGGLGEAVAASVRCSKWEMLAVREAPHSGKPMELLGKYGIDAKAIVAAVKRIMK